MTTLRISDFQIGDRVEVVDYELQERKDLYLHQLGTVAGFDGEMVVVEHDDGSIPGLDSCNGIVKSGRGWFYYSVELEIIAPDNPAPVDDLL